MWTVRFVYETEDGTRIEGQHTFDKSTRTFSDVLLALVALNGDDVITEAEINYIDTPE